MVGVALAVIALDQATKWWALRVLDDGHVVHVVWTLQFNLLRNAGAAFSTGQNLGPLIAVLALGVIVVLVRMGRVTASAPTAVAIGLVIGGAAGNLADRLFRSGGGFLRGHVIDFIDFQWWPVFNVADIAVVVGAISLAVLLSRAPASGST